MYTTVGKLIGLTKYFLKTSSDIYSDIKFAPKVHQPDKDPTASTTPKSSDSLRLGSDDVAHIREHLKTQYGMNDDHVDDYMKEYDAQTQFFAMHDYDNNTKLDGLELLKAMTHNHDDEEGDGEKKEEGKDEESLVDFVDLILKDQDYNNDGYIDLVEYYDYHSRNAQEEETDVL